MRAVEPRIGEPQAEGWGHASREMIDAWENSVKLAVHAQLDWTEFWLRRLSDERTSPKEFIEWSHQTYELMKAWTDAQIEMWDAWFTSLRTFGPLAYTSAFVDVSKSWQEAARKSLDASGQWLREWSEQAQRVGPRGNGADVALERPTGAPHA